MSFVREVLMVWVTMKLVLSFANANTCKKSVAFKVNFKNKALINRTISTLQSNSDEFCQSLCFRENRCISCTFDTKNQLCNLSDTDHIMHPKLLVNTANTIYWRMENSCNCDSRRMTCRYNPAVQDFRCYCNLGFTGTNCTNDLKLVALFPLNARYQARSVQSEAPNGVISNVQCNKDSSSPTGGSCLFNGNKNSFIEIPNAQDGKLDLKGSMTLLAFVYAENDGGPL
ncbi:uncharacterized protein LOC114574582, partial [Exaiptasia diaphana]|uniref:EGF-like domain-containing protein n=1 Tax=Exaiptasia diaphana TaxID=2652724 RepID=A0A913YEG7_EXADI